MTSPPDRASLRDELEAWRELVADDRAANPGWMSRLTLAVWRLGNALHGRPGPTAFLMRRGYHLADLVWCHAAMGADLPPQVRPGRGVHLAHGGRGIVLHPTVRIGDRVRMYHQVTVGVRDDRPAATLEDDCYVGAGAKILGPVTLGAGTKVGANAVVLTDTEPGSTWVGVPARRAGRRP